MVMDTQTDAALGASPTLDDVLDLSTANIHAYNDLQIQGSRRFRILWDKRFIQGLTYNTAQGGVVYPDASPRVNTIHNYYKKMRKQLYYNGNDATGASVGKNAIWLFIFQQDPTTAAIITINGVARIRYTDV